MKIRSSLMSIPFTPMMIQQDIFVGVFNGLAKGMNQLAMIVIMIMIVADLVLLAIFYRFRSKSLQIAIGILSLLMFLLAIRCLTFSDDFFIAGIVLSLLSIIGFIRIYTHKPS